jgi:hypothetical protein
MKPADDYADLGSTDPRLSVLACWEAYSPESKVDYHSSALGVDGQLYFVDPIPLQRELLAQLAETAAPAAILLTSGNHARAAEAYKKQLSIPIYAHADAREELGIDLDGEFLHTSTAELNAFEIIALRGAAAGEVAIFTPLDGGVVVMGDALINLPPYGFTLLPDKYCSDAKELRRSLTRLLEFSFEKMLFAHGTPIISGARRKLETLLA